MWVCLPVFFIFNELAYLQINEINLLIIYSKRDENEIVRNTYVAWRNETIVLCHSYCERFAWTACFTSVESQSKKGLHLDPGEPVYSRYFVTRLQSETMSISVENIPRANKRYSFHFVAPRTNARGVHFFSFFEKR